VASLASSAETRLDRLLERLLTAAETSLAAGDLEPARVTAEEVRAVDPDNARAARILRHVATRQLGPSGERALMTLLFSDLVGSTMLSEQVEPEQLRDLYAFYRTAAREAVSRYRGNVMQYLGDGILAAFGYPEPHEDDAGRAVLAGLDLGVALRDAHAELGRRFGVAPEVRVGIHTGRVVVTDLSQDPSVAERDSIVGLVPNLAARIQQAAEPGMVVISDVTRQLVDADFYMHSLGERHLKGITRPVEVFAVERPRYAAARFEVERYRKAGLVGRDEPRDRMLSAWDGVRKAAGASPGAAFLLVGEAGIGKSRLVAEVLDRVQASGGRVLGVGCLPYYANVSLWPVARLLERVLALTGQDGDRLAPLVTHLTSVGLDPERSVPFLGSLIGLTAVPGYTAPELDPSAFLDETLNRVVEWVSALARDAPHLLVVEDLHWADPSTLALLGRLVERPPPGLLTVATTRDASPIPWTAAVDVLELGRLDSASATTLIANLSAGQDLAVDLRAAVVDQAEGIPLFVEELTRSYLDDTRDNSIPLRLQELFTSRLKAPGVDLRVVQIAATVGPTFDAATVRTVAGDDEAVTEQLRLLADEGIIEPVGPPGRTYRFRHALMRDAAYETQVLDVRRATHADVAETIAASDGEPALIAQHLDLAGAAERAAGLYVVAAQAEQGRGAHPEATRLLTRAVELLAGLPESDERDLGELTARMLRALSVSSMRGYAAPEVQADHRRAEELATRLGRAEVLPSLIAVWGVWLTSGDLPTAQGVIDRLLGMVEQPAFGWFEPEVQSCAGYLEFYEGHLGAAQARLEHAIGGFAGRPPDQLVSPFWPLPNDPIAASLIALACVSAMRGETEAAARWEGEALGRAEEVGFPRGPFSVAFVKTYAAWIRRFLGEHDDARRLGAEVVAIGQQHGYAYWISLGSTYLAAEAPGGQLDRAFLEQAIATLRLMGHEAFVASALAYLAQLNAQAGDVERAQELVDEALHLVHKAGEDLHLPELLRQRAGYTLALGGSADTAVADLTEAIRLATEQGARVARLRAAVQLARVPAATRPGSWRAVLAEARADLPASWVTPDTAAADDLLGS
jgi:class 3 adenylate cyclase/tetratricopeptide (TPR) repeat protein